MSLINLLIIQSAGSSLGDFTTTQGGSLTIAGDGLSITYTPPADYNGAVPDTFSYVVADVPGAGQPSLAAPTEGDVSISFVSENDPPRTNPDTYSALEGMDLTIPVNGTTSNPGILDNDSPGPSDEVAPPQNQTIELVAGQFPKTTDGNGTVTLSNDGTQLIYTPAPFFSGTDRCEYTVIDRVNGVLDQTANGEVFISVGEVNDSPVFVGVQGNPGQTTIVRDEAKLVSDTVIYQLNTWFTDPDGEDLTFSVTSNDLQVADPTVQDDLLVIEYPAYGFGTAVLTVIASDGITTPTTQLVNVVVNNTPDSPQVIGTLDPQSANEDGIVSADLMNVFLDPDGDSLTFDVARLDSLFNPTAQEIADHPLIDSISFVNGQMEITLKPDQFGTAQIEISASDGESQPVSNSFTLTVDPVPDAPVARPDGYNVPIGSELQVLNVTSGLLRNDSDADGEDFTVDLPLVTPPSMGTLDLNEDGTFVYTNTSGQPGQTDSFTYNIVDSTDMISETVTVTLTLNESEYQNPLADLTEDVTADGFITAIDALRIINFLGRRGAIEVPVSEIGSPPPDFLDVNGSGKVSALDALNVVNKLREINNPGAGEQEIVANPAPVAAAAAVTSSIVSATSSGLPFRNLESVVDEDQEPAQLVDEKRVDSRDRVMASGFEIVPASALRAFESADQLEASTAASDEQTDVALAAVLDQWVVTDRLE